MKRLTVPVVLTALALLAAPAAANAAGAPKSSFNGTIASGGVVGDFTWYGRSVGVNGQVRDYESAGSTSVVFKFWQYDKVLDIQSRTASNGAKNFGWTEAGVRGGFTKVDVYLSHDGHSTFVESVPAKGI